MIVIATGCVRAQRRADASGLAGALACNLV